MAEQNEQDEQDEDEGEEPEVVSDKDFDTHAIRHRGRVRMEKFIEAWVRKLPWE